MLVAGCGRVGFDARIGDDAADSGITRIAAGMDHACLIRDGALFCWGRNDLSQLGLGDGITETQSAPQRVPGTQRWVDLALGEDMSCGLDDTGAIWCWGSGDEGRLGLGVTTSPTATTPTQQPGARRYRSLHPGREHTCAIGDGQDAGTLWCWGRNGAMQLGNGTTAVTGVPTQVAFNPPDPIRDVQWASVGGGSDHTCATQTDNTLWCWGSQASGQLGQGGPIVTRDQPNPVDTSRSWVAVDSGFDASCATTTTGEVYCWGRNANGQLGVGDTTNRDVPTLSNAPASVDLEFAYESICARTSDNRISCSGQNDDGELGRGTSTATEPMFDFGTGSWSQIAAGDDFVCGIDLDGSAFCFGVDAGGQLGNGGPINEPDSLVPVPVAMPAE